MGKPAKKKEAQKKAVAQVGKAVKKEVRKDLKKAAKAPRPRVQLSGCVLQYARVVTNPYEANAQACLPADAAMTQPNAYYCMWSKGTGGTAVGGLVPGYGFIMTAPFKGVASDQTGADCFGYATQSTFTMTAPAGFSYASTGVGSFNTNSPFTKATSGTSAATAVQWRVIAAGLRIRYTGTAVAAGAMCYPVVKRDHATLAGDTLAMLQKDPRCHSIPLGRQWVSIVTVPSEEEEIQFHTYDSTSPNWSVTCMGFFISAPDNTVSTPFEYEAYIHCEAIGPNISNYRDSAVDPLGAAAVLNAIKRRGSQPILYHAPWNLADEAAREIGAMSGLIE